MLDSSLPRHFSAFKTLAVFSRSGGDLRSPGDRATPLPRGGWRRVLAIGTRSFPRLFRFFRSMLRVRFRDRWPAAFPIVFEANGRCNQENLLAQLEGAMRSLTAPLDNLLGNEAYMAMGALAWNLKAWAALLLPEEGRWEERRREEKGKRLRAVIRGLRRSIGCPILVWTRKPPCLGPRDHLGYSPYVRQRRGVSSLCSRTQANPSRLVGLKSRFIQTVAPKVSVCHGRCRTCRSRDCALRSKRRCWGRPSGPRRPPTWRKEPGSEFGSPADRHRGVFLLGEPASLSGQLVRAAAILWMSGAHRLEGSHPCCTPTSSLVDG